MPAVDQETINIVDPTIISPGSDFGPRYRIEALLGQGGMGRVYKAYDKDLDRVVALKVVRQGMVSDADALRRFKQELILASKISHKNILRIHDMGEVDGMKFITMAYVEGQDLHQIIADNPKMPLERMLSFSQQLAEALAAAHSEGVVHRDLKPQNILVAKNDQIFVSDFGLAKSFEEGAVGMTRTGAFVGTPRYMSPEQVEGKPADQRSDLYAYGLILYEMAAGDVPFTGESTLKVMYQRIQEKPKNPKTINPNLPNWFVRIIMRCLEKEPPSRYQNAYEILSDLQGGKSGSSASASRTVQIQIPEFAERRWTWWVAGALALLTLMFAIPPVRHLILGKSGTVSSSISGIPPLASGRFVAVLPLRVLGDPSQLGYLAQGIQEAISAKLFQLQGVRVTSADAASKADQNQPIEKLARSLGANLLVQGTLQGAGDKIRVVMNLEDVTGGKRRWSEEFDGVSGDLFTLEDQIYGKLIAALDVNPTTDELAKSEARPTDNVAAYDLYLRGRNDLRGDDINKTKSALDYFNQALKQDPKFALAYTGIADASLKMYATNKDSFWAQKAIAAAQQAERLNENLSEVHFTLGSTYAASGKYSEAIAELKRAISLAPNSDEGYRRLGSAYLNAGQNAQAIEGFQKAIQLNPYYWVNQNSLGTAYFQLGDYAKALEAFQQISVLEPDLSAGYENVGNIYLQQGEYEKSIPYLQKAIQIQPYFTTYSNLGTAYFFLKKYPESVSAFQKAVELNPNDAQMYVNLGDAYRWSNQQEKARATYQQAVTVGFKELSTNPQDAEVMAQMALAFAKSGDSSKADEFIHRAMAIDKENVMFMYYKAEIDAVLGRKTEGLKSLQVALAKNYPAQSAETDPELGPLKSDPEFGRLIKKYSAAKP